MNIGQFKQRCQVIGFILAACVVVSVTQAAGLRVSEIDETRGWRINGDDIESITSIGDFNGDALADFAMNIPGRGKIAVVYGKRSGFDQPTDIADLDGTNGFVVVIPGSEWVINESFLRNRIRSLGDFNGDGRGDLIISVGALDPFGAAYILFGQDSNSPAIVDVTTMPWTRGIKINAGPAFRAGDRAFGIGDVNSDGKHDAMMCWVRGPCSVVFGRAVDSATEINLSTLTPDEGYRIVERNDIGGLRFVSSESVGDINGDSINDFAVQAQGEPDGIIGPRSRNLFLVFGSTVPRVDPLRLDIMTALDGFRIKDSRSFELTFSAAGDINNDGLDDLLVRTGVIYGSNAGFEPVIDVASLDGNNGFQIADSGAPRLNATGSNFPFAAGDVNGDGIDDFGIGSPEDEEGIYDEFGRFQFLPTSGSVYIVLGIEANETPIASLFDLDGMNGFQIDGDTANDSIGTGVRLGDVNGDGIDDLGIGFSSEPFVPRYSLPWKRSAFVLFGSTEDKPNYLHSCGPTLFDPDFIGETVIWQDCPGGQASGRWHVRIAPPFFNSNPYKYNFTSDGAITDIVRAGSETDDLIDQPSATELIVSGRISDGDEFDGFDFSLNPGSALCFDAQNRSSVVVGVDRFSREIPADIGTGTVCEPRVPQPPVITIFADRAAESELSARVLVLHDPAPVAPVQINFSTRDLTAKQGQDYYGTFRQIQFEAGERFKTFDIQLIDDSFLEGNEWFMMRFFGASDPRISDFEQRFVIIDNESAVFPTLRVQSAEVQEGDGQVEVLIEMDRPATGNVKVTAFSQSRSARGGGVDYGGFTKEFLFAPGETRKSLFVRVIDDDVAETTEFFAVQLARVSGANLAEETAKVTIIDNDRPPE